MLLPVASCLSNCLRAYLLFQLWWNGYYIILIAINSCYFIVMIFSLFKDWLITFVFTLFKFHRVRFHYGHPDIFDRIFHVTRGGVSKASKTINLSEDIFSGEMVFFNGDSATAFFGYLTGVHLQVIIQLYEEDS